MFDINLETDISIHLAQASDEQVISEASQNKSSWIEGRVHSIRAFQGYMRVGADYLKRTKAYAYKPAEESGIPALTIKMPIDYRVSKSDAGKTYIDRMQVGLASQACLLLDVEAQQAGAWGPECKIGEFIALPEGALEKWDDPGARDGDYYYTPPRIGTDRVRFILENGVGKRVDVTIYLEGQDYSDF